MSNNEKAVFIVGLILCLIVTMASNAFGVFVFLFLALIVIGAVINGGGGDGRNGRR